MQLALRTTSATTHRPHCFRYGHGPDASVRTGAPPSRSFGATTLHIAELYRLSKPPQF
jgi:hypothetical protein